MSTQKDWIELLAALGPTIIGIATIVIAIIANCISNKSLKQQKKQFAIQLKEERRNLQKQLELQKKQWLNEAYIKNEANILFEFKDLIYKSQKSFNWFADILHPYKIMSKMFPEQNVKLKEEDLIIKFEDYCKHYDCLNALNNFYNKNQMILRKNDIENEFEYIIAILTTFIWFKNTNDFYYTQVSEDKQCIKYKLNIIDQLGQSFVSTLEMFHRQNFEDIPIYTEEKLGKYSNEVTWIASKLIDKLDKIITYHEDFSMKELLMKRIFSFASSEQMIQSINNKQDENNDK